MAKRVYFGLSVVFTAVFLLNALFIEVQLKESYQQAGISRLLIPLYESAEVIQERLNTDRNVSLSQYQQLLNETKLSIVEHPALNEWADRSVDRSALQESIQLAITNKTGFMLVSTEGLSSWAKIPDEILSSADTTDSQPRSNTKRKLRSGDLYYVYRKIESTEGKLIGYFVATLNPSRMSNWVDKRLKEHREIILYLGIIGFLFVMLCSGAVLGACRNRVKLFSRIYISTSTSMLFVLVAVLVANGLHYQKNYVSLASEINASIIDTLASPLLVGIPGMEDKSGLPTVQQKLEYFQELFDHIHSISLSESPGAGAESKLTQNLALGSIDELLLYGVRTNSLLGTRPIIVSGDELQESNLWLNIELSVQHILEETWSFLIDGVTLLLIALLLLIEFLYLLISIIKRTGTSGEEAKYSIAGYMRPAMFFFLLGIDISMAFVPLHMENLYTPLFGLSKDIVMGLPISVEFLFVGVFILVSGIWVDKRGWHEPFLIGLVLSMAGGLYSWIAPDAMQFIVSRAIIGTGYGLTLMASQGFIVKYSSPDGKATGLANLFAGLYAGSICGAVIGSVLAEIYGYRHVFMLGGLLLIGVIAYTLILMHSAMHRHRRMVEQKKKPRWAVNKVVKFLVDPEMIALSLFSSMPASIAVVGFLNYFVPVYLDEMSVPESTIGQVLMIYGFSLIFMGPIVGHYIDKSESKKNFVVFGGIIGAVAFLSFDANAGVSAAIISVILLGISSSFVLSSQSTMILNLKVTKELGEAKALGIFRSISRLGQVTGPIIFGGIFLATDINQVMNYFGLAYLSAVILLIFIVRKGQEKKEKEPILEKGLEIAEPIE